MNYQKINPPSVQKTPQVCSWRSDLWLLQCFKTQGFVTKHISKTFFNVLYSGSSPYNHKFIIVLLYIILKVLFTYKNNQNIPFPTSPSKKHAGISLFSTVFKNPLSQWWVPPCSEKSLAKIPLVHDQYWWSYIH